VVQARKGRPEAATTSGGPGGAGGDEQGDRLGTGVSGSMCGPSKRAKKVMHKLSARPTYGLQVVRDAMKRFLAARLERACGRPRPPTS
jgi:hypothetical protein